MGMLENPEIKFTRHTAKNKSISLKSINASLGILKIWVM